MTDTKQPEALRMAAVLENHYLSLGRIDAESAAAELRRLHAENVRLAAMVDEQVWRYANDQ